MTHGPSKIFDPYTTTLVQKRKFLENKIIFSSLIGYTSS